MSGPTLPISQELHAEKYRRQNESFVKCVERVARGLGDNLKHEGQLFEVLEDMRFMPGGRVQAAINAGKGVTPYNCFSGDQKFLTRDGVKTFWDMKDKTVEVLSPVTGRWHETVVRYLGVQTIFEYDIAYGFRRDGATFKVQATEDHTWLLKNGERVNSLNEGDLLAVTSANVEIDPLGFVHGFVFGDGCRLKETTPTFNVVLFGEKDQQYKEIFELLIVTGKQIHEQNPEDQFPHLQM